MAVEFKLHSPPTDAISSVRFGPTSSQFLLVSSWDSKVRLYDVNSNNLRITYQHERPVLDACFQDAVHSFSGGLDNKLKMYDFNSSSAEIVVGKHDNAIRCIEFSPELNSIITGSWDATVKLWDTRSPRNISSYTQPDKVFTMSLCGHRLVVGTAGRKVNVWDLRNMGHVQRRESSLKYQTRCIRCFPNQQGYVLSSIEGRVAVEYFDTDAETQKKKYAFKCHRIKEGGIEQIYPVNTVSFHQTYNTFATGGSDGYVNIWDGFNKKRLCQFHKYNTSVVSLSFCQDGTMLAVGCSYMYEYENHPDPIPEDNIYIRNVTDQETKPK